MKMLVIDNHSPHLPEIIRVLKDFEISYALVDQATPFNKFPQSEPDGIILSGGEPDLDEKIYLKDIRGNLASILNYDVPIFGICYGHQILTKVFGGSVRKLNTFFHKHHTIKLHTKEGLFEGLPDTITVLEDHGRYVRDVPYSFDVTAGSKKSTVEAIFHAKRPLYGVQFHPEESGKTGNHMFNNFFSICKSHAALPSLTIQTLSPHRS